MVMDLCSQEEQKDKEYVPLDSYATTDLEQVKYLMDIEAWQGVRTMEVYSTDSLARKQCSLSINHHQMVLWRSIKGSE